jgi:hypothetical protein
MEDDCIHHWLIDDLNYGRCLRCPGERQFPRAIPEDRLRKGPAGGKDDVTERLRLAIGAIVRWNPSGKNYRD